MKESLTVSGLGAVALSIVAVADAQASHGLTFSPFYLAVIVIVAWNAGAWSGFAMTALAACGLLVSDLRWHVPLPVALWNGGADVAMFTITVVFVDRLRARLLSERAMARSDQLTGLMNAFAFKEACNRLLPTRPRGMPVTLVFFDLDNFKQTNDTFGHLVGSAALARVGEVLRENLRTTDLACRFGGDEFAALLWNAAPAAVDARLAALREKLLAAMAEKRLPVTFSIGAVTYEGAVTGAQALSAADALMYEVKRNGKNSWLRRTV